jgi:Ornithine decarboxylase antizyme
MALMELASPDALGCTKLVVCLSRSIETTSLMALSRDLGWAGFEMVALEAPHGKPGLTSEEWLFFEVET